ncbi:hypothetical protein [Salipaludibacillus sp. CF4.18]|uniref:hypothetical protein n=1 Tax=Salipaludibacillus sp. CF4.18 TaxID=3373081 RepID=UPI003EE680EB
MKKEGTQKGISPKKLRQKKISEIIQSEDFYTHSSIIEELNQQGIQSTQATISRDLRSLNLNEKEKNQPYKISEEAIQELHKYELESMMKEISPTFYEKVSYCYLKTKEGKASGYAFHLQKAFPGIIIDLTIGIDNLVMLINLNAATKDFFAFLENN